ncbi:MAG: sigma-70 family RNA polymerase sigma factor [Nanoarchaeota archaeon]
MAGNNGNSYGFYNLGTRNRVLNRDEELRAAKDIEEKASDLLWNIFLLDRSLIGGYFGNYSRDALGNKQDSDALITINKFRKYPLLEEQLLFLQKNNKEDKAKKALANYFRIKVNNWGILRKISNNYIEKLDEYSFESSNGPLDKEEIENRKNIIIHYRNLLERSVNKLIEANLRFVIQFTKRYYQRGARRGIDLSDLIQEGALGMRSAANKYDFRRKYRFMSYASWWVRQAVQRFMNDQSCSVRLPVHFQEIYKKYLRTKSFLERTQGFHNVTDEEVAKSMDVCPNRLRQILSRCASVTSIDAYFNEGEDEYMTYSKIIADDSDSSKPEELVCQAQLKDKVDTSLKKLDPREEMILRQRFGVGGYPEMTLEDIGNEIDLTRERIRQLESKALSRLKHPSRVDELSGLI